MKQTLKPLFNYGIILILILFLNSCKDDKDETAPLPPPVYNNCKIMAVKIFEIPPQKGPGKDWDAGGKPDIFIKIMSEGKEMINMNTMIYGENNSYPIFWDFPFPLIIGNLKTEYDVYVYDDDAPDLADIIGTLGFVPKDYKDYPAFVELNSEGTKLQLELQWY